MIETQDVDAAKAVLVEWLDAWQVLDWQRMAANANPLSKDLDEGAKLLSDNFHHRRILKHSEPEFKDGHTDTPPDDERIGFADFAVSVALADGQRTESFVARVIGIGSRWGVNAVSTMKRTTSPPGKGQQWQTRRKAKSSPS